jgi:PEP-CTERM motif-containing protein
MVAHQNWSRPLAAPTLSGVGRVPRGFFGKSFPIVATPPIVRMSNAPIPCFQQEQTLHRVARRTNVKLFLACLFTVVLSARCAFADPVAIQAGGFAGVVDLGGFPGPSWDLRGAAFHLTGLFTGIVTGSPCPCAPDTTLSLTHGANVSGHGDVTLGSQLFSDVDLRATFDVQSPTTITLPSTIDPHAGFAFRFDFLLTGDITGLRNGETLFTQSIIGNGSGGVANFQPIVLANGTATHYRDVANFYNFDEFSGPATPEPASFLLLATGTLTLLRRRQRLPRCGAV